MITRSPRSSRWPGCHVRAIASISGTLLEQSPRVNRHLRTGVEQRHAAQSLLAMALDQRRELLRVEMEVVLLGADLVQEAFALPDRHRVKGPDDDGARPQQGIDEKHGNQAEDDELRISGPPPGHCQGITGLRSVHRKHPVASSPALLFYLVPPVFPNAHRAMGL